MVGSFNHPQSFSSSILSVQERPFSVRVEIQFLTTALGLLLSTIHTEKYYLESLVVPSVQVVLYVGGWWGQ